jgi:hypothetical protein
MDAGWEGEWEISQYVDNINNCLTAGMGAPSNKVKKKCFKCSYEQVSTLYSGLIPFPAKPIHDILIGKITHCAALQVKYNDTISHLYLLRPGPL